MSHNPKIAVIGGGAAGFFAAIQIKEKNPNTEVLILEKSKKLLSKVKISGGGRCNVTNSCENIGELASAYPRGGRQLRKLFGKFSNQDMMQWLEENGIELEVYSGSHVFPKVNDSQIIIDLFLRKCREFGIEIKTETHVISFETEGSGYNLITKSEEKIYADKLVFAYGGQPKRSSLEEFEKLGYKLIDPVPSLFTFNMPKENTAELMGIVVEDAIAKIEGEKLEGRGPLLFTHWGMSGPAILLLSAWGARILHDKNYAFKVRVSWLADVKEEQLRTEINQSISENSSKYLKKWNPYQLPNRLWIYLSQKIELNPEMKVGELGKKSINKLINILLNDTYEVQGKTTFKEEFVTAGGIALENLDMKTMESKIHPGVYFIGEMIDIDGITGGYNFQACWTEAWVVGESVKSSFGIDY